MADEKKVGLSDMMDGTPRHNTTLIDVTQGKIEKPVEEVEEAPVAEVKKTISAESTATSELNKENLKEVNPFDILPPKKVEKHTYEDELMSKLDMAVEREKESITERIDAITEKQREEFEEAREAEDMRRMEEEDKETVGVSLADGFDDADSEGDYGEDEENNITISKETAKRTTLNLDDTVVASEDVEIVKETPKATPIENNKKDEEKKETTDSILSGIDDKDLFNDEDDDKKINIQQQMRHMEIYAKIESAT